MRYYLDTEFNGFGGELLSLALVREDDGEGLYVVCKAPHKFEEWVSENIVPILSSVPQDVDIILAPSDAVLPWIIAHFLAGDASPHIIADWPDDIAYFCKAIITGPGTMAPIPHLTFEVWRVDAYPTTLPDAVRHNAWWDAAALRHLALYSRRHQ